MKTLILIATVILGISDAIAALPLQLCMSDNGGILAKETCATNETRFNASAQDRINAIVEKYKKRLLSPAAAIKKITNIKSKLNQGLPGYGDYVGAWIKFKKSSRTGIDELRVLLIEAKEAELDLGQLRENLRYIYGEDEMRVMIIVLHNFSINTIDELENLDEAVLIEFLVALDDAWFFY